METFKKFPRRTFGLICLFFIKVIVGFAMWLSTLPFTIGVKLVGLALIVSGILYTKSKIQGR